MLPTASIYNQPPYTLAAAGVGAPEPKSKMANHPAFLVGAMIFALVLVGVAIRYGWVRFRS